MRKPKIAGMAIFDWITSLLAMWIIGHFLFGIRRASSWMLFLLFWIALGVFVHWVLGINTMLGYYLGISPTAFNNLNFRFGNKQ